MPEPACPCGSPPYTDGRLCPACLDALAAEKLAQPGGPTLADLFGLLAGNGRDEDDGDDGNGDDDTREDRA